MGSIRLHLKKLNLYMTGSVQLDANEGSKWMELTDATMD